MSRPIVWNMDICSNSTFIEMGLRNGDKILALDGDEVERWRSIHHDIVVNGTEVIQVERDGKRWIFMFRRDMTSRLLKVNLPWSQGYRV